MDGRCDRGSFRRALPPAPIPDRRGGRRRMGAYCVYEYLMYARVLCSGECNIRVDLLLAYPALAILGSASLSSDRRWVLWSGRVLSTVGAASGIAYCLQWLGHWP